MAANSIMSFPREIGLKRKHCHSVDEFKSYVRRLLGKSSLYVSLYHFRAKREDKHWKFDYKTAVIDKAWWDFDSGKDGGIELVKQDVTKLLRRLNGEVRVVATGRGFHVFQFFNRPVCGHEWRGHLNRYQRLMAKDLPTLDGVGLPEKLVRVPNTYNAKRGRWSVCINADEFMTNPDSFTIPKKPDGRSFSLCPFLGVRTVSESFDFVRWVHDNPTPTNGAESHQNAKLVMGVDASTDAGDIPLPPCISNHINSENPNHFSRMALVQHLSEEMRWFAHPDSVSDEQWETIGDTIYEFIKGLGWRDFNPYKTRHGIRTNMKYKQSPTCRAFEARNMCAGKCWRYDGTI